MAARRRGLTLLLCDIPGNWGCGVLAPVASGVERLEGSSEVKIVAEDGDIRYLLLRTETSASLKPM